MIINSVEHKILLGFKSSIAFAPFSRHGSVSSLSSGEGEDDNVKDAFEGSLELSKKKLEDYRAANATITIQDFSSAPNFNGDNGFDVRDLSGEDRYCNLTALVHSQVVLARGDGEETWLNANYVTGKYGTKNIIAQGPTKEINYIGGHKTRDTRADFVRMAIAHNVSSITALGESVEGDEAKYAEYIPDGVGETREFDNVKVTKLSSHQHYPDEDNYNNQPYLEISLLKLENNETEPPETRIVPHFHVRNWPDKGVLSTEQLINFSLAAKIFEDEFYKSINKESERFNPRIVHCSAGVGRSGVWSSAYDMTSEIKSIKDDGNGNHELEFSKDPEKFTTEDLLLLRAQRHSSVETEDQFNSIVDFSKQLSNGELDSSKITDLQNKAQEASLAYEIVTQAQEAFNKTRKPLPAVHPVLPTNMYREVGQPDSSTNEQAKAASAEEEEMREGAVQLLQRFVRGVNSNKEEGKGKKEAAAQMGQFKSQKIERISLDKSDFREGETPVINQDNVQKLGYKVKENGQHKLDCNYYAMFGGLTIENIDFGDIGEGMFMNSFRGVKFNDCDFSKVPSNIFKTINFFKCEFKNCKIPSEHGEAKLLNGKQNKKELPYDSDRGYEREPGTSPFSATGGLLAHHKETGQVFAA